MRPIAYVGAIAAAIAIGASGGGGGGGTATILANIWMNVAAGSCTRSSTPVAYNPATACGTLATMYQAARNGDIVLTNGGTYAEGAEPITAPNASITLGGLVVTLTPAHNAAVTFNLQQGSPDFYGVQNLTINGHNTDGSGSIRFDQGSLGVIPDQGSICQSAISGTFQPSAQFTLANASLNGGFTINNGANITFTNLDVGDFSYPDGGVQDAWGDSSRVDNYSGTLCPPVSNHITLTGLHFHNIYRGDSVSHAECLFIHTVDTMTVQQSNFDRCPIFSIFLQSNPPGQQHLTIQNNRMTFQCPDYSQAAGRGVPIGGGITTCSTDGGDKAVSIANCNDAQFTVSNLVVRYNSFDDQEYGIFDDQAKPGGGACGGAADWDATDAYYGNEGGNVGANNVSVDGCVAGAPPSSMANWVMGHSVIFASATCSATDQLSTVAAEYTSSTDFHLIGGAKAIDNVPTAFASGCPPTDFDGRARPQGAACDTGAYEH